MKKQKQLEPTPTHPSEDILNVRIEGEVLVSVPNSIDLMSTYILLEQEDWFEDEIKFLRHWLQPGMNALDIGANYGVYTLTIAAAIGQDGHVWAFEPASITAGYLRHSIQNNNLDNITLIQSALSNHTGTANLSLNQNTELNSLQEATKDSSKTETVQVNTLDQLSQQHAFPNIDLVKLDAEGQESNILAGGSCIFVEQSPLVIFEIKQFDKPDLPLVQEFMDMGYQPYRLIKNINLLVPFELDAPVEPYQLNLFCCKEDRANTLEEQGFLIRTMINPQSVPDPGEDLWKILLSGLPYAKPLMPLWVSASKQEAKPGWEQYRSALNLYLLSRFTSYSMDPAFRYACLKKAETEITTAFEQYGSLPRLQTLSRILADIGQRNQSKQVLLRILNMFESDQPLDLNEPFIVAMDEFEIIAPDNNTGEWCLAAVISQYEKIRAYSSYFMEDTSLKLLSQISESDFLLPEVERRMQLIRARFSEPA